MRLLRAVFTFEHSRQIIHRSGKILIGAEASGRHDSTVHDVNHHMSFAQYINSKSTQSSSENAEESLLRIASETRGIENGTVNSSGPARQMRPYFIKGCVHLATP